VIGDQTSRDLVRLEALSDGGFLVGMHTRSTGTQQIELRKYSSDLQLIWTKLLGNQFENKLLHIFEDKDGKILISGVSIGYGQEEFSLAFHKTWFPFFTLIDHAGNVAWETFQDEYSAGGATAVGGSGTLEKVHHIIQDSNGDYFIALNSYNYINFRGEEYSGMNSNIIRLRPNGEADLPYKFDQSSSLLVLDGMVMSGDDVHIMCFIKRDGAQRGDEVVISLKSNLPLRFNAYEQAFLLPWPWEFELVDSEQPTILSNGDLVFSMTYNGNCYSLGYTPGINEFKQNSTEGKFSGIAEFHHTEDDEYVFFLNNKDIVLTNSEFSIESSFHCGFDVKNLTTLKDGSLVVGVNDEKSVTLVKYARKGNTYEAE